MGACVFTSEWHARIAVDRAHAVPIYHQLFLLLREEIVSGARPRGSRLPTEEQLAQRFTVSRVTARRALDQLAEAGLVERRRRVGTRVIFRPQPEPFHADFASAIEALLAPAEPDGLALVDTEQVSVDPPVDALMGLVRGTPVLRTRQARVMEGERVGQILRYCCDHAPAAASARHRQTVGASLADAALAAFLPIQIGAPVLRVTRLIHDEGGAPFEYLIGQFRADRCHLRLDPACAGTIAAD